MAEEIVYNEEGLLLNKMDEAEKEVALAYAVEKIVPKGTVLIHQGDDNKQMFLLREGAAKVVINTATGKELILDYIGPAQLVGELSVFDDQPSGADVITIEESRIAVFHKPKLMELLNKHPSMAIKIIQVLCHRLRKTNYMLESDRSYGMAAKLARGLMRLVRDHGDDYESGTIRIKVNQSDLGNYVALSRENVNRQLKELQRQGIIKSEKGRIEILDIDTLEDLAIFGD